jgi:hypothetical protein
MESLQKVAVALGTLERLKRVEERLCGGPWKIFDFFLEATADFSSIWLFRSTGGKSDV